MDGKPFTTYMWPDALEKPVLYPITTASGTTVTRSRRCQRARRTIRITSGCGSTTAT